jgi:DNA polymerase-3 subunit delta'
VVVIDDAQNMKVEAANALLKVLEEPPPDNLLILTAPGTTALLPTIVSRCLELRFQPLSAQDIAAHLGETRGVEPERAAIVAQLAGGSLSEALALLDEEQLARRQRLLETAANMDYSRFGDVLSFAEEWRGDNSDFRQDLEWLKTWTRDLLVHNLKAADRNELVNFDRAGEVAATAPQFRSGHLVEIFEFLCTLQRATNHNINKRLGLESLLLLLRDRATTDSKHSVSSLKELGRSSYIRTSYG